VADVPGSLLDHVQGDPTQIRDFTRVVEWMPYGGSCIEGIRGKHGIGSLTLVAIEGEHVSSWKACGHRVLVFVPLQRCGVSAEEGLEPVAFGEAQVLNHP